MTLCRVFRDGTRQIRWDAISFPLSLLPARPHFHFQQSAAEAYHGKKEGSQLAPFFEEMFPINRSGISGGDGRTLLKFQGVEASRWLRNDIPSNGKCRQTSACAWVHVGSNGHSSPRQNERYIVR